MRDIALTLALVVLGPLALRFPFVGVYLWVWLSLMNPHRLTYGFAEFLQFNMVIAGLTLLGCLFTSEKLRLRATPVTIFIAVFSIWITITTIFAPVPEVTNPLWSRNIKILFLMVLVIALITSRHRLNGLMWVMAVSLAYYGIKGGGFMILTGGNSIVFGPFRTMIADNNALSLALIMTLPILNYLRLHTHQPLLKLGLIGTMVLTLAAVIGSYSRGGFIAMAAMLGFLWLKGRSKLATAALGIVAVGTVLVFMPAKYMERINTIDDAMEDSSFRGRLDAWEVAFHTANDRLLGAGFDGPRQDIVWKEYLPERTPRASHSIYFMVLGEHGYIGFVIYMLLCFAAWRNFSHVLALTRDRPELLWARDMASMLQVSMLGFLVGGAALPMAYYDGFLIIMAAGVCLRGVVERAAEPAATAAPVQPSAEQARPEFATGRA
jgi:probable O-glycosylation ligase (exosortase A-associated)